MQEAHKIDRQRDLSPREFYVRYDAPAIPVIVENATRDEKAASYWTMDFCRQRYGQLRLPVIDAGKTVESTVSDFIDRVEAATDTSPATSPYGMMLETPAPELLEDIVPAPGTGPARLNNPLLPQLRRFRMGPPELVISGPGGKFVLHYHDLHVHTYVTQVIGDKILWLYPPSAGESTYPSAEQAILSAITPFDPVDSVRFSLFTKAQPYEALLHAGDSIFIAAGGWHRTRAQSPFAVSRPQPPSGNNSQRILSRRRASPDLRGRQPSRHICVRLQALENDRKSAVTPRAACVP